MQGSIDSAEVQSSQVSFEDDGKEEDEEEEGDYMGTKAAHQAAVREELERVARLQLEKAKVQLFFFSSSIFGNLLVSIHERLDIFRVMFKVRFSQTVSIPKYTHLTIVSVIVALLSMEHDQLLR